MTKDNAFWKDNVFCKDGVLQTPNTKIAENYYNQLCAKYFATPNLPLLFDWRRGLKKTSAFWSFGLSALNFEGVSEGVGIFEIFEMEDENGILNPDNLVLNVYRGIKDLTTGNFYIIRNEECLTEPIGEESAKIKAFKERYKDNQEPPTVKYTEDINEEFVKSIFDYWKELDTFNRCIKETQASLGFYPLY